MRRIKPVFLVDFNSAILSGGLRRAFEILKIGRSKGIYYVILTNLQICKNAVKMFISHMKILSNYKVYIKNAREKQSTVLRLEQAFFQESVLGSTLSVSKAAKDEEGIS